MECVTIKILMVDDERPFVEQAKIFLEKMSEDLDISFLTSAEEAIDELRDHEYDGVVSDYQMPYINGVEFLKILREEKDDDIPFIMFTGKGREEVAMKALNLGADRYLQKGGDPKTQYGVLAQAIDQEVEHYRTKKRIKTLSEDLQETFNTISDPIFLLDTDHKILRTNDAAEEFFGKDQEYLLGEYCHKIAHGQDEPIENCPLEKSLETKEVETLEFYHDGLDKHFIARTNPILDDDGEIKKVIHQEIDVTEIKEKEEELGKSKRLFESIFHDPDMFIGILDLDGNLIRANKASLDFIGASMDELEGEPFWKTSWWDHSEDLQERLKRGIERAKEGERVRFDAVHHGQNGGKIEVDFSLRAVRGENDSIQKLIAYGRDIDNA